MSTLPAEKMLAVYWIPDVGIGKKPNMQHVTVPLTDILNFKKADGTPQVDVVFLAFAHFAGSPQQFTPPYISIPDGLLKELVPQAGQSKSNVQLLRDAGIRVMLSIQGNSPDGRPAMGWDGVPPDLNRPFAKWMRTEVLLKYGLDGIDIDNEFSGIVPTDDSVDSFLRTVATFRAVNGDFLLSKAIFNDDNYFLRNIPLDNPDLPGGGLLLLLDFGCLMYYGLPTWQAQISTAKSHNELSVRTQSSSIRVGLPYGKLCIGVQAGPKTFAGIHLPDLKILADWLGGSDDPPVEIPRILGMMLWTFSQDIQQWTHYPQNSPDFLYPNADDHEWQRTIITGMWPTRREALAASVESKT